jgi:hypothetical protein
MSNSNTTDTIAGGTGFTRQKMARDEPERRCRLNERARYGLMAILRGALPTAIGFVTACVARSITTRLLSPSLVT